MAKNCPSGTYNITNPGYISTREVVRKVQGYLQKNWAPEYWLNDDEFYRFGAWTPRSNCILDSSKLLRASIQMRSVDEALEDALLKWKSQRSHG
jgi:dTDP-4-dehydrorhamnose reductase